MSEYKTSLSSWTTKQKADYLDLHTKGLRGQTGAVTVHQTIKDDKGRDQLVPVGASASSVKRQQSRAMVKQQRKATARGE